MTEDNSRKLNMDWTTRVPQGTIKRDGGDDKAHYACFLPKNWQGEGLVFRLLIPEGELQADLPRPPGAEPAVFIINGPPTRMLPLACQMATKHSPALYFVCDTAKQAERAARKASKLLPNHERVALERMHEPHTSARSGLH